MSQVVNSRVRMTDRPAIQRAVARMYAEDQTTEIVSGGEQSHQLYSRKVAGLGVRLRGWRYPAVVKADGEVAYDNFEGRWGNVGELDRLSQCYTLAAAEAYAADNGYEYHETEIAGGTIVAELTEKHQHVGGYQ